MSIKEKLLNLRKKALKAAEKKQEEVYQAELEQVDLNARVDAFIAEYRRHLVEKRATDNYLVSHVNTLRNLIEKMAIWYELRYPNAEIFRMMYCEPDTLSYTDEIVFQNNPYLKEKNLDFGQLEWEKFYNRNVFFRTLSEDEKEFVRKPHYWKSVIISEKELGKIYLSLSNKDTVKSVNWRGFIGDATFSCDSLLSSTVRVGDLIGLHIEDAYKLLQAAGLPNLSHAEAVIKNYHTEVKQRDELLNAVMYRIIERGGSEIGPRRALIFAKEFGRNIDIPMKYGVERSDLAIRQFVSEYIKAGGTPDLECYLGYFHAGANKEELPIISIREILEQFKIFTPEEVELHKKLASILRNRVDASLETDEGLNSAYREVVQRMRLERKIAKSRERTNRM